MRFACGQLELGPNPADGIERYHIQFYVALRRKRSFAQVKALLGDAWASAHFEVCTDEERSLERVEEYCNDPGKPDGTACQFVDMFRFGKAPSGKKGNQGKCEVQQLVALLEEHGPVSLRDALQLGAAPGALSRHLRLWDRLRYEYSPQRSHFDRWVILTGPPGTGKGHCVNPGPGNLGMLQELYGIQPDDCYVWTLNNGGNAVWLDERAVGKTCLIVHEFNGQLPPNFVKELIDHSRLSIQSKGGQIECCFTTVVFTSNFEPTQWWAKLQTEQPEHYKVHWAAIERRIKDFGVMPNYRQWRRNKLLEQRLAAQGGLHVVEPGSAPRRRITPERTDAAAMDMEDEIARQHSEWALHGV